MCGARWQSGPNCIRTGFLLWPGARLGQVRDLFKTSACARSGSRQSHSIHPSRPRSFILISVIYLEIFSPNLQFFKQIQSNYYPFATAHDMQRPLRHLHRPTSILTLTAGTPHKTQCEQASSYPRNSTSTISLYISKSRAKFDHPLVLPNSSKPPFDKNSVRDSSLNPELISNPTIYIHIFTTWGVACNKIPHTKVVGNSIAQFVSCRFELL